MLTGRDVPQIDLNDLANSGHYDLQLSLGLSAAETSEDRMTRLRIQEAEARHIRWRATAIYILAIAAVVSIFVISAYIVLKPDSSEQDKTWARPILATLVLGLVGYAIKTKVDAQ